MNNVIAILSISLESLENYRFELIEALSKSSKVLIIVPICRDEITLNKFNKLGVEIHTVRMSRKGMNPIVDMIYFFQVIKVLYSKKVDAVFSCRIKPVIWGSLAARLLKIKSVPFITGLGFSFTSVVGYKKKLLRKIVVWLYKISCKRSSTIIFQNKSDRSCFATFGILNTQDSLIVNGSGINCKAFSVRSWPPKEIKFLMVSRLLAEKGVFEYCKAATNIKTQYPGAKFELIGYFDGSMKKCGQLNLKRNIDTSPIHYYGKIDDVRDYIDECSVFVLPSYREGTPRSVLEAMAMGRPIITTDAPGCRETVSEGVNGYLVAPRSAKELEAAMAMFCSDPSLLTPMGRESRKLAEHIFEVHKVNKKISACLA